MIFKKNETPAVTEPAEAEAENPFIEAANTLVEMEQNGELPDDFDLSEANLLEGFLLRTVRSGQADFQFIQIRILRGPEMRTVDMQRTGRFQNT